MFNRILSVDSGSPLRGRIQPGESLVSVNGHEISDVLDYKFYTYDAKLELTVGGADGKKRVLRIRKGEGQDLGLDFETYLMDRPRRCANNCIFCFIDQLPPGMRKTMYFKDDDARLSFLMGNYITLTNLTEREIRRISDLRISPINVSVHTTNPELRVRMLRNPAAAKCVEIMRFFAESGITMNCQIVCCPGINDGAELERTMRDLESMWPAVHSVSVVPVGITKYREGLYELEPFTPGHSRETVEQVTRYGDGCLERRGERIFYCGDEMYLKAGLPIPCEDFYEDFAQLENGVGMLRLTESEFRSRLQSSREAREASFSLATGTACAAYFERLISEAKEKFPGIDGKVYGIENDFFGRSINVAGLVTGRDLTAQLKGRRLGEYLLISHNMLRSEEMDFLDGVTLDRVSEELGVPVYPVKRGGGLLCDAVLGILPEPGKPRVSEDTEYCRYNTD